MSEPAGKAQTDEKPLVSYKGKASTVRLMPDFLIILYSDTGDRTADVGQGGR